MLTSVVLVALLATAPVQDFAARNPASSRVESSDGRILLHASGFLVDTGLRRAEDSARAFLATEGAAFGVNPAQELVLTSTPLAGEAGGVHFARAVAGLPVFGGDVVVGVDGAGRVFMVNATTAGPSASGLHLYADAEAARLAAASFEGGVAGAGPAAVARGWRQVGAGLRAVYRVDFVAREPAGDWRVFVDGETGRALFRQDLRVYATAPASVYEVSPTETAAAACPVSGTGGLSFCASPVTVTLPNLTTGADLSGSQAAVYNCRGADAPTSAPGGCAAVPAVNGAFQFAADTTWVSPTDDFSAVMAYYHLDRHASFFKALDPTLPPPANGRALSGSLPALVNAYKSGAPYENAYYSGLLDAMVFGQGATADYAYDGTVMYHEFTHGVVAAWGDFQVGWDSMGAFEEGGAVNEGTADAMASSRTGHSQMASFVSSTDTPAAPYMRDMADPTASRTCQGDGTLVTQLGQPNVINGIDGEVHDDGEIWNGFYWEVYQGLKAANVRGCSGACEAGPAIQYKAIQLAGQAPSLSTYWQTFRGAASVLFPGRADITTYLNCVAQRRRMSGCDRTVPVYAGESKAQYVRLQVSPLQVTVQVTAAGTQVQACSRRGTAATLHATSGRPVRVTPTQSSIDVTSDRSIPVTATCNASGTNWSTLTLDGVGTWYLLFEAPTAMTPSYEVFKVRAPVSGVATRPATPAPGTCSMAGQALAISPATASAPPRGSVTFSASGGSGTGYAWTLQTNASGGTIDGTTGAYVAGPNGWVTDVVAVSDDAGGQATRDVTVTAGLTISPPGATVATGGSVVFAASGGSGTGLAWSFLTNASGGSINATTGAYVAGATGGVTDVVQVRDSLSNSAIASVGVTGSSSGGGGKGCNSSGGAELASLGVGLALLLRRRGAAGPRRERGA